MLSVPEPSYVPGPYDLPPQFGPYRILRKLGKGAMGAVYLALDPRLDRRVALKIPTDDRTVFLDRFTQEARAAARLHHRNLCHVYETGAIDGLPYLTLHFVEGRPLSDFVADFAGQPRRVVALVEKLTRAMAVAHAAGVLHRDLKPANILLDVEGEPVVVDFGLAARLDDADRLTRFGDVMGTPAYMAPEQHAGRLDVRDPRLDVYALGVILYELLTGRRPFDCPLNELARRKDAEDYEPPTRVCPGLDARLDLICGRALAADPARRYASMDEMARALAHILDDAPDTVVLPAQPGSPPPAAKDVLPPTEPGVAQEGLELVRVWGWEEGLKKLDERIRLTEDDRKRGLLQLTAASLRGQLGGHNEALEHYREAACSPELKAWAALGEAFVAYRSQDVARAAESLGRAEAGDPRDAALTATCAHLRGALLYKQGDSAPGPLAQLFRAAETFGPNHHSYAGVLDTLGMVYVTHGDFALADAFYGRSIDAKLRHDDRPGLALTYGQIGRLFLEWGDLDGARTYFEKDLSVCWSISDIFGEAKMYNHQGQVELERGAPLQALAYLDESVARGEQNGWTDLEAYARKDRGRAYLALQRLDDAEADGRRAEELFRNRDFAEGTFHARRVLALVQAARGQRGDAERGLRDAATFFAGQQEYAEAARTWLELAGVQRRGGSPAPLATHSLRQALEHAERSRREKLVEAVERELAAVNPAELAQRTYERARGRGIPAGVTSLTAGRQETASMLCVVLRNFSEFARREDALIVCRTLNQIWADLEPVLERRQIVVNQYQGDGFTAFARGDGHDRRAAAAGLDMLEAVTEFNRPRRLLGLMQLDVRVGVSRGSVLFANIGAYRKMDFMAVGSAANEAARLLAVAAPGAVCVSAATWKEVGGGFAARDAAGRSATLEGIGLATVWDVAGLSRDETHSKRFGS